MADMIVHAAAGDGAHPFSRVGQGGGPAAWQHTKALYRLSSESRLLLQVQQAFYQTWKLACQA